MFIDIFLQGTQVFYDILLQSVNLLWKTAVLKCWLSGCVFAYFYIVDHKNNFCL